MVRFDYEVNLGDDFVPFHEAKAIVHERIDAEIAKWQLTKKLRDEETFWTYRFELIIGDAQAEILINAITCEIIHLEVDHDDKDIDENVKHLQVQDHQDLQVLARLLCPPLSF